MKSRQQRAYFYAFTSILFWSTIAVAFKIALSNLNFIQFLFWCIVIALLILFIVLCIQKKIKTVFSFGLKDYLLSAFMGFLNPFLYYIILFKAYSVLPAQIAQPLNYTWPVILVLLSVPILKQKISYISIIGILVSFTGVFFISLQGNSIHLRIINPQGVVLAVSSSVVWAFFWIFNIRDKRDEVVKLFLNFFFSFFFILPTVFILSEIIIPRGEGLVAVIYSGFFEMGITFLLWLKALTLSRSTDKVSRFVFLSPVLSLFFIHYFLGENIYFSTIIGLLLIIGGIIIHRFFSWKEQ